MGTSRSRPDAFLGEPESSLSEDDQAGQELDLVQSLVWGAYLLVGVLFWAGLVLLVLYLL